MAQRHAVIAHELQEMQRQRPVSEREVVERAHGPVTGIQENHWMARGGTDMVHVRGNAGIGPEQAPACLRIDVESYVVRSVRVVVEVRRLEDGEVARAVLFTITRP